MNLHIGDDGYTTLLAFWQTTNGAQHFNYQMYMWYTAVDDTGRYFWQGPLLESFQGLNHGDRPIVNG